MRNWIRCVLCLLLAVLLCGCSVQTVEQMYQTPKRSKDYSNLQSVMDKAMAGLDFCAPITGDNQQTVQMADVDGDEEQEYLVFAKGSSELPLRVLVFDRTEKGFVHADTIESNGAAFDQIEYVQMDDKPGVEIVVGRQISDQLVRSVSVYTFASGEAEQMMTANYRKYVTVDMNGDGRSELFVLRPGQMEIDNGIAELYSVKNGNMERSNEQYMSCPADNLKRILVGKLQDKKTAVYVASSVESNSLVTDVFVQSGKELINVSLSGDSVTGMQTLRNYYVYADDIDDDGVVELPRLMETVPLNNTAAGESSQLILWYAMTADGTTVNKLYTYYDVAGGWYLCLDEAYVRRVSVLRLANVFEFYLWNEDYSNAQKLMTIHMFTGQNRDEQSIENGRFVLLKTDTITYAADLDAAAAGQQITQESLIRNFYLIHRDWNTGET